MENKFNIGRKVLSDSEIAKHKDFTSLYRTYQITQKPLYKTTRFIAGISVAAAAVVIFVFYFSFFRNNTSTNLVNPTEKVNLALDQTLLPQKINPPLAGINVPRQSFHLKAAQGGAIKTASGTEITVPADAFVDQKGNKVSGDVEIQYREFSNPLEFFLSGIPNHQTADNQVYRTESAGMFEILAFQHNQSLSLNKNKVIGVDLLSFFPGEFQCFYLDTNKQQWVNRGESLLLAENGRVIPEVSTVNPGIDTTGLPVFPRKANKKKFVFNIKVDVSGFPELAVYNNLLFEVNEDYGAFDERLYDNSWDKASLTASKVNSNYDLTLSIRDTSVTIVVYPVFSNKNYEEAVKLYQEKKQVWLARQKANPATAANLQTPAKSKKDPESLNPSAAPKLAFNKMKPLGKRHVDVTTLGIYQCGKQLENQNMRNIRPVIKDLQGNEIHDAVMYVAEREHNTLSCFGRSGVISFRSEAQNLFWAVTQDGKIGVLSPESFALLTRDNAAPGFKMVFVAPNTGLALIKNALQI